MKAGMQKNGGRFFCLTSMLAVLVCALTAGGVGAADDLQKTQKKALEAAAKALVEEAKTLEHSGKLVEARLKYAESLGQLEVGDARQSVKRLDDLLKSQAKSRVEASQKLYDAGKYREAAQALESALELQTLKPVIYYDLALCYHQLHEERKAADYLDRALTSVYSGKLRARLGEMRTAFVTGETAGGLAGNAKNEAVRFDHLAETVGNGSTLEDELGDEEDDPPGDEPAAQVAAVRSNVGSNAAGNPGAAPPDKNPHAGKGTFASACGALQGLRQGLAGSAAANYNLANCAEDNNRPEEATQLLKKYLELSPNALDHEQVTRRIGELDQLRALENPQGPEVRKLHAAAVRAIEERKYDRALANYTKASEVAPDFALTYWKLGLLQEAMGKVRLARQHYTRYKELAHGEEEQKRVDFLLGTLDEKRQKYEEEVSEAQDIIADLLNRAMNLTFNSGLENRSGLKARRGKAKGGNAKRMLGGFTMPFEYAQQQLAQAGGHLQAALALFPLGAEANELQGIVYLQAMNGRAAMKSFDAVASQNVPVSFYVEVRGHHGLDRPAKCELSRDHIRLIFLAEAYDNKGTPKPPKRQAGSDGLGDLVIEAGESRALNFEDFAYRLTDIKKVETRNCLISLKLQHDEFALAPLFLATTLPTQGPPARRFSNDYTRLFVRYPGLEDSKLGAEGMTGYEKFQFGMNIASDAASMAMGGVGMLAVLQDVMTTVQAIRQLQAIMAATHIQLAAWEEDVKERQEVLVGNPFKPIPTEPLKLGYLQQLK